MVRTAALLFLLPLSQAVAQHHVLVDGDGNVMAVAAVRMSATTETTYIANVTVPREALRPRARFDEFGRCRWRLSGATVSLGSARWPSTPYLSRERKLGLIAMMDELGQKVDALTRWQADPRNVLAKDRSAELVEAQRRFDRMRDILAGP